MLTRRSKRQRNKHTIALATLNKTFTFNYTSRGIQFRDRRRVQLCYVSVIHRERNHGATRSTRPITVHERTAICKSQLEPIIENPGNTLGAEQAFGRWFADGLYTGMGLVSSATQASDELAFHPGVQKCFLPLHMVEIRISYLQVNPLSEWIIGIYLHEKQSKPCCYDSGVLNLHHVYYTTIMTPRWLCRHNPVSRGTNQPIRKSEFRTVYECWIINDIIDHRCRLYLFTFLFLFYVFFSRGYHWLYSSQRCLPRNR